MTAITDAPPGTVPEWAIRVAHDGEQWLVLAQADGTMHPCYGPGEGWYVLRTSGFKDCKFCGFTVAVDGSADPYDDLAEAHAAFERLEREWLEAKR